LANNESNPSVESEVASPKGDVKSVVMPPEGQSTTVHVAPNDEIKLKGVDLDKMKVDIVGDDIILLDEETGSSIVLAGMALIMFEPDSAPTIVMDSGAVDVSDILGRIDQIGNLDIKDFIAISSVLPDSEVRDEEVGGQEEEAKEVNDNTEEDAMMMVSVLLESQQYDYDKPEDNTSNVIEQLVSTAPPFSVDQAGNSFAVATKKEDASASSTGEQPPVPTKVPLLEVRLLQPLKQEDFSGATDSVFGGGGSQQAAFEDGNAIQLETEVLDYSSETTNLVVYADDASLFNLNKMSRDIEFDPSLPDGFAPTGLVMEGLPASFDVIGFTPDADGNYVLDDTQFIIDDRGNIRFTFSYPVPSTLEFDLFLEMQFTFDPALYSEQNPGEELLIPDETTLTFDVTHPVEVRDVAGSFDLNYEDANGDIVWVLSNDPNSNIVLTGSGDDQLFGAVADDTLSGGLGDDTLDGARGDDFLQGGKGNDSFIASLGDDSFEGGDDYDTIDFTSRTSALDIDLTNLVNGYGTASFTGGEIDYLTQIEQIITGVGNDTLRGDANANEFITGGGNDSIFASAGTDTIESGVGADWLNYSSLNGTVDHIEVALAGSSLSTITVVGGDNDIVSNVERIVATSGDDILTGDARSNWLYGEDGDDVISGGAGTDRLFGGDGVDELDYSSLATSVSVDLDQERVLDDGFGIVDEAYQFENVTGSQVNDTIVGNALGNVLDGDSGADSLSGLAGDDTFIGGAGVDTFDGGDDIDVVSYLGEVGVTSISATLNGASLSSIIVNGGSNDQIRNVEGIIGTIGDDSVVGDSFDNRFFGMDGNDTLVGGGGDDTLDGGEGLDTASYITAGVGVDIDLALGVVSDDGEGGQDTITGIENITGSNFADSILGNDLENVLTGGSGNDTLAGGEGDDTLDGAAGNDTADYGRAIQAVDVNLSTGQATIDGEGGVDTLISIETVSGSNFDDTLTGSDAVAGERLFGSLGDDILTGGAGNDTLDGGDDVDTADYTSVAGPITANLGSGIVTGDGTDSLVDIENITGTSLGDNIFGNGTNNTLLGGAGDDTIRGGAGSDSLDGGIGADELRFDDLLGGSVTLNLDINTATFQLDGSSDIFTGFETYYTSNAGDSIYGSSGADTVFSLFGDDVFFASGGIDTLDGGLGFDIIDYSLLSGVTSINAAFSPSGITDVTVNGGDNDALTGIEGIIGSVGNDTLTGNDSANLLDGAAGNDTLIGGDGEDTLRGGSGVDVVDYTSASIGVVVDLSIGEAVNDGDGNRDFISGVENVIGTSTTDVITGNSGANELFGGDGNDTLSGGAGDDTLRGQDGSGDVADYTAASGSVVVDLSLNRATDDGYGNVDTFDGIEIVIGSGNDDTITGNSDGNSIVGGTGNDVLEGLQGNDTLIGGDDIDTADYRAATGGIDVDLSAFLANDDGYGGTDTLTAIEHIIGSDNADLIQGDGADNSIIGGTGDDTIRGGQGYDTLIGGIGTDELRFDDLTAVGIDIDFAAGEAFYAADGAIDTFTEFERYYLTIQNDTISGSVSGENVFGLAGDDVFLASGGVDTLQGDGGSDSLDYSLLASVSSIAVTLTGSTQTTVTVNGSGSGNDLITGIENIIGTAGADVIVGDAEENRLEGMVGNDDLRGAGGADVLIGGDGNDTLDGGDGDDSLDGGDGADSLRGGDGDDTLRGGGDIDTADYTLAVAGVTASLATLQTSNDGTGGVDDLIEIENLLGSNYGDALIGGNFNNSIDGGDGFDFVQGGIGNDTLVGGLGTDTVSFEDLTGGSVTVNLQSGTALFSGDGSTDIFSGFESVDGSAGGDTFIGSTGADQASGLAGDDVFNASAGVDTFDGGAGDDEINYLGAAGVTSISVVLNGALSSEVTVVGSDNDSISNFENVRGTAFGDNITGDGLANTFYGEAGDDSILGNGGLDTIYGGEGNDTLNSGSGDDRVFGDDGNDSLLGGDGEDTVQGDAGDDTLDGGAGNDSLIGGDGLNVFRGRGGVDTFDGGTDTDTADYSAAANSIVVNLATSSASSDGDASSDVLNSIENVIGSGDADNITGDGGENVLAGGGDDDTIDGGAGDDLLQGDDGDDVLRGGIGNDTLEGGNNGIIGDAADYTLATNAVVANLTTGLVANDGQGGTDQLIGIERILGTNFGDTIIGSADDNSVVGGSGDDSFSGGDGNDTLEGSAGDDTLDGGNNNDSLVGGTGDDSLIGGFGADTLLGGDDDDILEGEAGVDSMDGGDGNDIVTYANSANSVTVDLSIGQALNDGTSSASVDFISNVETIIGSDNDDVIYGDNLANLLQGGLGDDIINGRGGLDTLDGGLGEDTVTYFDALFGINADLGGLEATDDGNTNRDIYVGIEHVFGSAHNDVIAGNDGANELQGDDGDDTLRGGLGVDTLDGGNDSDTADYSAAGGPVNVDLTTNLTTDDGDGANDVLIDIEDIIATAGNDTLTGGSSANVIIAGAGDDIIDGKNDNDSIDAGTGDDTVFGGVGADTLVGGIGDDELRFDDLLGVGVSLNLATERAVYAADGSEDVFSEFEFYYGSNSADTVTGSLFADSVNALDGDDTFIASASTDTLDGGAGTGDIIDYSASGATSINIALNGASDATVTVNGGDNDIIRNIEGVIATAGDDTIIGDDQANSIVAGDGDDSLDGGIGNDTLEGGIGNDSFYGSLGQDEFYGEGGTADWLFYEAFAAANSISVTLSGTGLSTIIVNGDTNDLVSGVENVSGTDGNDTFRGDGEANWFIGGAGNDIYVNSAGADTFEGGNGFDRIQYSDTAATSIEVLLNGDSSSIVTVSGGAYLHEVSDVENVRGSNFDDTIGGDSLNNYLDGYNGNDIIYGNAGFDTMLGGNGNDTLDYSLDTSGITAVNVFLNGGVNSTVTITGGDNDLIRGFENVIGTDGNDTLRGDGQTNSLVGGIGDDYFFGSIGNDTIEGDSGVNTIDYQFSTSGIITDMGDVTGGYFDVSYSIGTSVNQLANIVHLTGTNLADNITGDAQDNILSGGIGSDTIDGGDGNDSILGGDDNDLIVASAGNDTIDGGSDEYDRLDYSGLVGATSITVQLIDGVSTIVTVAGGDDDEVVNVETFVGTSGNDSFTGDSSARNNFSGGAGDDVFYYSAGNDTFTGGADVDTLDYSAAIARVSGGDNRDEIFEYYMGDGNDII